MDLETKPELIEAIRKMREMGMGFRAIAIELETKFNYKTSHQTVKNFIDSGGLLEKGGKEIQQAQDVLSLLKQLKSINKEMWTLYKDISTDKDKLGYARANILNKILSQLEMQRKLLERITSSTVTQKISMIEFSVKVSKYLEQLEKEGYIKIVKKPIKIAE